MFGWLRWWLSYKRHEDAYTKDQAKLVTAVRQAVEVQWEKGSFVWIVVHSTDQFEAMQGCFELFGWEYELATRPASSSVTSIDDLFDGQQDIASLSKPQDSLKRRLRLVLADLIPDSNSTYQPMVAPDTLSVIVVGRSSDIEKDLKIESFCRNLPLNVELGYFLSFEDPVVKEVLDPMTMEVFVQLGLDSHTQVTSQLITRRINKLLKNKRSKGAGL